jgi:hypothetical protein
MDALQSMRETKRQDWMPFLNLGGSLILRLDHPGSK